MLRALHNKYQDWPHDKSRRCPLKVHQSLLTLHPIWIVASYILSHHFSLSLSPTAGRQVKVLKNQTSKLTQLEYTSYETGSRGRRLRFRPYLIFVTSINSGASVKKLTEGNFFSTIKAKRTPDSYFTHNV